MDHSLLGLISSAGYWSKSLYNFRVDENSTSLSPNKLNGSSKLLLVVSRKHYFETVKDYPVGRLSDLKGILKNELWRYPFKGKLLLKIERLSDHSHRVTSWVIRQNVVDKLTFSPLFFVPESACIHSWDSSAAISLDRLGSTLFVSLTATGLVSIEDQETLFSRHVNPHSVDSNEENFLLTRLSESDSMAVVLIGAFKAIKQSPLSFYVGPTLANLRPNIAVRWLKISAAAMIIYLGTVSLFIVLLGYQQERDLKEVSPTAESVLKVRSAVTEKKRAFNAIDQILARRGQTSVGWGLLLDLKAKGAIFSAVKTSASEMEFFCSHRNATEILKYLKNDARVAGANLSSAINKEQGNERFSVRVAFNAVNYNNPISDISIRGDETRGLIDTSGSSNSIEIKGGQL